MSKPDTVFVTVTEKTDLENLSDGKIRVYPNPAERQIFIFLTGDAFEYAEIQVFDCYGQLV
jgi:hypothetical protein